MRAFAAKQNQTQKTNDLTKSSQTKSVQKLDSDYGLPRTTAPAFGHDFSRIPLHAQTPVTIQPKLAISTPEDMYEREADHIAEQVMRAPEPQLQRTCACGGECPNCQSAQDVHEHLQTKRMQANDSVETAVPPIVHEVLNSSGQPLDTATRAFMEPRFGHDFSRVRVHTDPSGVKAAQSVNALAFTVGRDVVFGAGLYATGTQAGRQLLAHELAHVVQQQGAVQRKIQRQLGGDASDTPQSEEKTPQQELEDLKNGNCEDDLEAYAAARRVLIASYANQIRLSPADEQLLIKIVQAKSGVTETPDQQQVVTPDQQNIPEQNPTTTPKPTVDETPEVVLASLKNGVYNDDPQALREAAKKLWIADQAGVIKLSQEDEQLLTGLISGSRAPEKTLAPVRTFDDYALARRTKYSDTNVQRAAWAIVQADPKVKDALLFFGRIKADPKIDPKDWDTELAKFFGGDRSPNLRIKSLDTTAGTPDPSTDRPGNDPTHDLPNKTSKRIKINKRNSFSVAVSSYLHEMCHYMDIWYESESAQKEGKYRAGAEKEGGIAQHKTDADSDKSLPGYVDPAKSEQVAALGEFLNVILDQIIEDREQKDAQPNEHPRVPKLRRKYQKWLTEREGKKWDGKNQKEIEVEKEDEKNERRKELQDAAIGKYGPQKVYDPALGHDVVYNQWGLEEKSGQLKGSGVELGYAFEKHAYGFYHENQQPGEWAEDFNAKFEQKYWQYLE